MGTIIPNLSDSGKIQAWDDLHQLLHDENEFVRGGAIHSLCIAFPDILDKKQAWDNLHQLSRDYNKLVRWVVAYSLGDIFLYIPDKKQGCDDLYLLTLDDDDSVREGIATSLGSAFSLVPDRKQAWDDLRMLSWDENRNVRNTANYSMGRVSIFKATETKSEEDCKKELENAIEFFKKYEKVAQPSHRQLRGSTHVPASINFIMSAAADLTELNPARFCLPFYQAFYTIRFKNKDVDMEVTKYLAEAENSIEGSENKEKLLKAIKYLANALEEVQELREMGLEAMKSDLYAYRRYIERASELIEITEEKAPRTTKLIKRELPIIDERIKRIIEEIQEKATDLSKLTKDTPIEKLGLEVSRQSQNLLQIGVTDPIKLEKSVNNFLYVLSAACAKMPDEERGEACELIKKAYNERYVENILDLANMALSKISSQLSYTKEIKMLEKKLDKIIISLKPGIHEELIISVGIEISGTGAKHEIRIPLQDITYSEIKNDLEKIKGKAIQKSSFPAKLFKRVKGYLIQNKKDEELKYLS